MTEHNIAPTFLRLKQIIGDDQSDPPVAPIIPRVDFTGMFRLTSFNADLDASVYLK